MMTAQKPLANRVGFGRSIRRFQDFYRTALRDSCEGISVLAVAVSNQELRRLAVWCRLPQLLTDLCIRWGTRHSEMNDAPRSQFEDEEEIELSEEKVRHRKKIADPDLVRLILQESRPSGTRGRPGSDLMDVFLNRGFGDLYSQFEKFAVDPFSTPETIVSVHLLDQGGRFRREFRTTAATAGFELPERLKALAMPGQERVYPVPDAAGEGGRATADPHG